MCESYLNRLLTTVGNFVDRKTSNRPGQNRIYDCNVSTTHPSDKRDVFPHNYHRFSPTIDVRRDRARGFGEDSGYPRVRFYCALWERISTIAVRFGQQRPSTSRTITVFSGSIDDTAGRRRPPKFWWRCRVAKHVSPNSREIRAYRRERTKKIANVYTYLRRRPAAPVRPCRRCSTAVSFLPSSRPAPGDRRRLAVIAHDHNWYCYRVRGPSLPRRHDDLPARAGRRPEQSATVRARRL